MYSSFFRILISNDLQSTMIATGIIIYHPDQVLFFCLKTSRIEVSGGMR